MFDHSHQIDIQSKPVIYHGEQSVSSDRLCLTDSVWRFALNWLWECNDQCPIALIL